MKLIINFTIIAVLACSFSACTQKQEKSENGEITEIDNKSSMLEILVGTYTDQTSKGIYLLRFDPDNGMLENKGLVVETVNPSYFTISKDRQYVYSVNETENGGVSSFRWNEDRSKLDLISQQSSEGDYPCYTELNSTEDLFAIGNYITGNILLYKIDGEGRIQAAPSIRQHEGSGPVVPNQEGAHAHCVKFSNNDKYLFAVDLGIDEIITYPVNDDGTLGEASSSLKLDPGDGPRHLIYHPIKNMAFVVNELSGSVVSMKVDHETGILERIDKESTLPEDYDGKNACADIHITSNGKFLYASNRGHNSIAIFTVAEDGMLERIGTEPVQGDWPRNFTLSPDEKYLIVANKSSDNITVFEVDQETGLLTYTGNQVSVSRPICLKF